MENTSSNQSQTPAANEPVEVKTNADTASPPLSKNALKRLRKQQEREAKKEEWKRQLKEKDREKKRKKREAIAAGLIPPPQKKPRIVQSPSSMRVVIDCSFDELMSEKEISSLASQVGRCHATNRASRHPCNVYVTSLNGRLKQRFETSYRDAERWHEIHLESRGFDEMFNKEELVYLSADASEVIEELDETKVYIIGGIVDKNRHKGLCFNKAKEKGIKTAQLPIGEYVKMATRKVLTVNHVYEILMKWLEIKDWETAFLSVIPKRKFAELKGGEDKNAEENEVEEEENEESGEDRKEGETIEEGREEVEEKTDENL
ncbi:uncharacterized protein VTP21DRAFT_8754 [Calcarisporiella thermophila]|uniref:uncharacterized protein n=1 Tax=Calcarisporiella thermophila TaxID=911321 RepID=UPI0037438A62